MNVYNEAHSLAQAIRESNEFRDFDRLRTMVENDPELSGMIEQLRQVQMQIQIAHMQGRQPDNDTINQLQAITTMLVTRPLSSKFMQAEGVFSVMMNDVFSIIGDAVGIK